MTERPILFSPAMVRAILEGRKTQTRRPVAIDNRPIPLEAAKRCARQHGIPANAMNVRMCASYVKCDAPQDSATVSSRVECPYGTTGDRLWVREAWHPCDSGPVLYAADYDSKEQAGVRRWFPSIHMKRVDSRISLEVMSARVERLNEVTTEDIRAEGVELGKVQPAIINGELGTVAIYEPRKAFAVLWNQINGVGSWELNPFVWVIGFRRLTP